MNFLFDAAAQVPEVNLGIERGMKLSELGRKIAMDRNEAELKIAGDEMASRAQLNMRPETQDIRTAGIVAPGWLSGTTPSGPSAAQIAAAAPAPAPVAPFGPNNGGRISEAAQPGYEASLVAGEAALPRNRAGLTNTPGITQVDPNSSQLLQDINKFRAGSDIDSAVTSIQTKLATGAYGAGTSPLARAWGYATDDAATRGVRADAVKAGSWWMSIAPAAYFRNNPDELAAATANPVKFYQDKVRDAVPANVWSEPVTPDGVAAKEAKASANNTPAAQALANTQTKAGVTPATVTGPPPKDAPVGAATSAGLAEPGSPSAAVAAEGATRFNMELRRAMSQRDAIINTAQQNHDLFMQKAQRADIMANAQLRISNPQGAKTYQDEAVAARQQANSARADMIGKIGQFDAAIQTNILGFATDRLNAYGDTATISNVFSRQADQPIAIRPSGTLGVDGKPTYNMWIQGKSGAWTAVSDAKSGKATPMSALDIAQRAQISTSSGYRGQLAAAAHEAQLKDADTRRKIVEKAYENVAERNKAIDVWKATEGAGYKLATNQNDTNGITFVSQNGNLMRFVVPPVDKSAPAVPAAVQYYGGR